MLLTRQALQIFIDWNDTVILFTSRTFETTATWNMGTFEEKALASIQDEFSEKETSQLNAYFLRQLCIISFRTKQPFRGLRT